MKDFVAHVNDRSISFLFVRAGASVLSFDFDCIAVTAQRHFDDLLRIYEPHQVNVYRLCDDRRWGVMLFSGEPPYVLSALVRLEFVESLRRCNGGEWLRDGF